MCVCSYHFFHGKLNIHFNFFSLNRTYLGFEQSKWDWALFCTPIFELSKMYIRKRKKFNREETHWNFQKFAPFSVGWSTAWIHGGGDSNTWHQIEIKFVCIYVEYCPYSGVIDLNRRHSPYRTLPKEMNYKIIELKTTHLDFFLTFKAKICKQCGFFPWNIRLVTDFFCSLQYACVNLFGRFSSYIFHSFVLFHFHFSVLSSGFFPIYFVYVAFHPAVGNLFPYIYTLFLHLKHTWS